MAGAKALQRELIVVDPNLEDYRSFFAQVESGFRLLQARTAEESLRFSSEDSHSLWLVNTKLPDMEGLELVSLLRERSPRLQCVLVTDNYSESEELSIRHHGILLYTCKPLEPAWLLAISGSRKPVLRDHYAHAPPRSKSLSDDRDAPIISSSLHLRPDS